MAYSSILKVVTPLQSAALLGSVAKKKKKNETYLGKQVKDFTNIMVGTNLIKETAKFTK